MGIRQCGKTFIAQHFAAENYKTVVYINFIKQPDRIDAFVGSKVVDDILLNLSTQIKGATFTPGETCFIFDEIQECPEARTSLKFFKEDGRFDVIATGSLLGVQGYGDEKKKKASQTEKPESSRDQFCSRWLRRDHRDVSAGFRGIPLGKQHEYRGY